MDKQDDKTTPPSPLDLKGDALEEFIANMTDEQKDKVGKEIKKRISKQLLDPSESAAYAIYSLNQDLGIDDSIFGIEGLTGLDVSTLRKELAKQHEALASGDMSRIENMLLDQAHTLQSIFMHFLHRLPQTEYLSQSETYSRLALKSQNQCRQTLATLGELKNPRRATFIKQQNNAVNQQIDNGEKPKKIINDTNEKLEAIPNEWLDTREKEETVRDDSEVETLGKDKRSSNA